MALWSHLDRNTSDYSFTSDINIKININMPFSLMKLNSSTTQKSLLRSYNIFYIQ